MKTTNVQAILSSFNHDERQVIDTLWAYLENGLLTKEEFTEIMITTRAWAYDDGFMHGSDYAMRAA